MPPPSTAEAASPTAGRKRGQKSPDYNDKDMKDLNAAGASSATLNDPVPTAAEVSETLTRWKREELAKKDFIEFCMRFRDRRFDISTALTPNHLAMFKESKWNRLRSAKHVGDLYVAMKKGKFTQQGSTNLSSKLESCLIFNFKSQSVSSS